ncbi:3-hydroxyisobutyryl-CoA hydrolase [Malassezia sp. CBS 17886]|nr:3-hydroxyisobutyryl-CoA hydrolase [Malassezia sp. CBS 17886]
MRATQRTAMLAQHMTSGRARAAPQPPLADHMDAQVQLLSDESVRVILLNRPQALNALNYEMIDAFGDALKSATASPNAAMVVLRGVGRALCAGGDVMEIVTNADSADPAVRDRPVHFFQKELLQNWNIGNLEHASSEHGAPKWYISIMDGIVMGGGVGLSVHAPFRVASERTLFAMPEVGIGFFPDVGVTHALARLDGHVGAYLALTGARVGGADVYLTGLASHYVRSELIDALVHRLAELPLRAAEDGEAVSNVMDEFSSDPFADDVENGPALRADSPFLGERRIALDVAFGQPSAERIVGALQDVADGHADSPTAKEIEKRGGTLSEPVRAWAASSLAAIKTKSPRSVKVALRAVEIARSRTLAEVLYRDMRIATAFCDLSLGRDFYVGVQHTLTKDPATGKRRAGNPPWNPARLEDVSEAEITTLFFSDPEKAYKAGLRIRVPPLLDVPLPDSRDARHAREQQVRGLGPLHWEPRYNRFALPSDAECAALAEGSHPAAGSYVLSGPELLSVIARHKHHKPALRLKVTDWLQRTHYQ